MSVKTWGFKPGSDGKWSYNTIEAYHRQSIAVSLASIADSLKLLTHQNDRAHEAHDRARRAELALRLIVEREAIHAWFKGRPHLPFSEFRHRVGRVFGWYFGDAVADGINDVPFLRLDSVGRGYRVTLIDERGDNDA